MKLLQLSLLFAICGLQAQDIKIIKFDSAVHGPKVKSIIDANEAALAQCNLHNAKAIYAKCTHESASTLVAVRDDSMVVGFVNGVVLPVNDIISADRLRICSLAVNKDDRRMGHGKRLFQALAGDCSVVAGVRTTNSEAKGFYTACGLGFGGGGNEDRYFYVSEISALQNNRQDGSWVAYRCNKLTLENRSK